jgi:hypothetical protein
MAYFHLTLFKWLERGWLHVLTDMSLLWCPSTIHIYMFKLHEINTTNNYFTLVLVFHIYIRALNSKHIISTLFTQR